MQRRNLILVGIAVVIGLFAVYLANSYFSGVERQQERIAEQQQLARIVVASQDVSFGTPLTAQNLRLANFPSASVPTGAFTSLEAATRGGRVALRPIVVGEPVLASKVSGTDGRAVLSANLPVGKLAYAIPINDTAGVGGFVRPGDRVDVLLTRQIPGEGAKPATDKMTDVIVEGVPVLGVDQVADEKSTAPAVAKSATLEVDTLQAQKLALGTQLGTLSLALRNVADVETGAASTVIPRHLTTGNYYISERRSAPTQVAAVAPPRQPGVSRSSAPSRPSGPTMTVFRGSERSEYEVQRGR
jgi:pilus assembly protein CpaB